MERARRSLGGLVWLLLAVTARGSDDENDAPPPPPQNLFPEFEHGVGRTTLRVGGVAALDYRVHDRRNVRDSQLRLDRAVLRLDAELGGGVDARLGIDLRGTDSRHGLEEAWFRVARSRRLRFTAGLIESPLGFEGSLAREDQPLVGNSFGSFLGAQTDYGLRLDGELDGGALYYDFSVGIGEGYDRFGQTRDSPRLSLRMVRRPFHDHDSWLAGSWIGLGFSYAPDFRGQIDIANSMRNKLFLTEPLRARSARFWQITVGQDLGPVRAVFDIVPGELFDQWFGGGSGLYGVRVPVGDGRKNLGQVGAWEFGLSWMITGEHYDSRLFDIRRTRGLAIDPDARKRRRRPRGGALELALRYNNADIDRGFFEAGLTAEGVSSQEFRTFTGALNWFPSSDLRVTLQGSRTLADGTPAVFGGRQGRDTSALLRVQLRF